MTEQDPIVAKIRRLQENIAVGLGVIIALTMSVYFFTYAMLVDKGLTSLLWAQGLSAIGMLLILFYLQQVSFIITRFLLGGKDEYRDAFKNLSARPEKPQQRS